MRKRQVANQTRLERLILLLGKGWILQNLSLESGFAASKGLLLNLDEVLPTQELRCKSIFICNWCPTLKEYRSCRAVMSCGGICFCAVKI